MAVVRHKEAIHSGHFMVSEFEAEADEVKTEEVPVLPPEKTTPLMNTSLYKLFQRMSIAYRQKLTSPKWNHFRGLKLRWKDKIRLNNVIWRCWHLQFNEPSRRKLLCAFANPLEIDNHNHTEGGTLLEGKYWKRKLRTITNEYHRWRLYYKRRNAEKKDEFEDLIYVEDEDEDLDELLQSSGFLFDALFSSLGNSGTETSFSVPFPNPRDVYKSTTNADFIQPGLIQLQPNFDDEDLGNLDWMIPSKTTKVVSPKRKVVSESSSSGHSIEKHPRIMIPPSNAPRRNINAEHKRRCSIKNGFEILRAIIPSDSVKISKAALLRKSGDYLKELKNKRNELSNEILDLKNQIFTLKESLKTSLNKLPSVTSNKFPLRKHFNSHVTRCTTTQNWKYWIFSLLMEPLLESFETSVGVCSYDDMVRTSLSWLDQHVTLSHLRALAISSLTKLSVSTDVLNNPGNLPQTSLQAVIKLRDEH